jgi:predicted  nucleic acid-binding Zn-ribbon protein
LHQGASSGALGQIETLNQEITAIKETEKSLRKTQEDLEKSSQAIKTSSELQDLLFKNTQLELEEIKQQYEANKTLLSDKIKELNEVKTSLKLKLKKVKTMARVLQNASDTLADTILLNEEQRVTFRRQ